MKEKLLKLLLAIGISKANAELMIADDTDPTKVDDGVILSEFKAHQLSLHENDPSIIKKIEGTQFAKVRDEVERKLRQSFGLTREEILDKTTDEIIKIAKAKASATTDKTVTELQQEILDKNNELKAIRETEIPAIKSQVENEKKQFKISDILTKKVSSHKLRNPLEYVTASVGSPDPLYDIDLDDKGDLVYYLKGTKLLPKNTDGTKFLNADDIIKGKLEVAKFLVESGAGDGQNKAEPIIVQATKYDSNKRDLTKLPGYEAALKHLADMKSNP